MCEIIDIYPAGKSDLEEILALQKKCYISEAQIIDDYDIAPLKQTLESINEEFKSNVILKAVSSSQIIGSIRAYKTGNTCYIGKIIVDPAYQNKGLGKRLLKTIEDIFSGCEYYELFTGFKSEKNLYIYNATGYKEFKREKVNEKLTIVYLNKLNEGKSRDRAIARKLAYDFNSTGRPLDWFESLYQSGEKDISLIPWADYKPNPNLVEWIELNKSIIKSGSCLVVGCGLGDDAEYLAETGLEVDSFDISATAISLCKKRDSNSRVNYFVDDITKLENKKKYDFIFEAYTLQVLPFDLRQKALLNFANLLNKEGLLLIICRARDIDENIGNMPWPLTKEEFEILKTDFECLSFEDYQENSEIPPVRRFRILYKKK
jgi:SAM-dependent methyltransferase/GNAT superfamily N-acetyltransferase